MRTSAAQRSPDHLGVRVACRRWFADCLVFTRCPVGIPVLSAPERVAEHGEWCRRVTYPDPDEQERDGPASRGRSKDRAGDDLENTHAAFDRIVAGLRAEPDDPHWPAPRPAPKPAPDTDEDHYDPPEPPPFPTPRPRTVGGVLTLIVGLFLVVTPSLLGLGERMATPLGLLALAAGIGWLAIGLRPDPPPEGSDDGARL
jgi:hypothetical protein